MSGAEMNQPQPAVQDEVEFKVNTTRICGGLRKGAKQYQEDMYFGWSTENVFIGGIFDGHGGYNGKVASNAARDAAQMYFDERKDELTGWSEDDWTQNLTEFFAFCHNSIREQFLVDDQIRRVAVRNRSRRNRNRNAAQVDLTVDANGVVRRPNGYPVHGGTTGTVCVLVVRDDQSKLVVCANAGDSDAILVKPDSWDRLSVDHGPDRVEEFLRVKALDTQQYPTKLLFIYDKENVYRKYECPLVFLEDGTKDPVYVKNPWGNGLRPTNVRYDPAVYAVTPNGVNEDVTCIAMTRSLADFYAHQFGLTHEPSVNFMTFGPDEIFEIALASDGVWDCWHFEAFGQFVHGQIETSESLEQAVSQILDDSIAKAKASFGVSHFDDASLIVILSHEK